MTTYYLNADTGNDSTGDGSSGSPWLLISKAQTEATNGDTVILQDSTAHYLWAVLTMSKAITYSGVSLGGAIIDADSATTTMWTISTNGIIFNNLDFTGLAISGTQRGGFRPSGPITVEFNDCRFYGNTFSAFNGIFCSGTANSIITPTLNSCSIYNNSGGGSASMGSIFARVASFNSPILNNCTIHLNGGTGTEFYLTKGYGGTYFTPDINNTILVNSQAISVDMTFAGGTGISTMDYSCYFGTWAGVPVGTGNINSDPLFVDIATNNYNLIPSSPCIDTGTLI